MGPRSNLFSKKIGRKSRDTVPLKELIFSNIGDGKKFVYTVYSVLEYTGVMEDKHEDRKSTQVCTQPGTIAATRDN